MLFVVLPQVSRHPGPPYPGHDLSKTHPSLAGTPPGHATSPALSQVSVPAAPSYRFLKGWETGGGVSTNTLHNSLHNFMLIHLIFCLLRQRRTHYFGVAMFFWLTLFRTRHELSSLPLLGLN